MRQTTIAILVIAALVLGACVVPFEQTQPLQVVVVDGGERLPVPVPGAPDGEIGIQANVPVYLEQGGAKLVVGSGGEIEVQSGATLDVQSGATTDYSGGVDLDGADLIIDADGDTKLDESADDAVGVTTGAATGTFSVLTGNLKVGNGTPGTAQDGEDAYVEGGFEVDGTVKLDGAVNIAGAVTVGTDGTAPDVLFYSDTAGDYLLWDQSEESLIITGTNAATALSVADGNVAVTDNLDVGGTSNLDEVDIDGVTNLVVGTEHIGLTSVITASVVYTSSGAIFTITDGEIWFVHDLFIDVGTNFDCTGDNCTMTIGDGNDVDGFLTAADANLQAAFTEATGYAAGWYGIENGSNGAYTIDDGGPFVYAPVGADETIDIVIGGTDPAAGAATVYIIYTRIQ